MSNAAIVSRASGWANYLVKRHHRGPGDTVEAAMSRASRKHSIPEKLLWSLRYRRPKRLWADAYLKLQEAYENECLRQEAKLRAEVDTMKRIMGNAAANDPVVLALDRAIEAMEAERET